MLKMDPGIGLLEFLSEAELQHYYDQIKSDLKIVKTSQLKYATDEDLVQLGMSRPEQRRLKKYYAKYFPQNYLSRIKRLLGPGKKDESQSPSSLCSLAEERLQEVHSEGGGGGGDMVTLRTPNKHIIPAESITINKELGVGEFGVVQQGVWTNDGHRIQVAIKCLCRDRMHTNSMEFLKEAAIMHSIEHKSIVRLYGVVLHPDSLMLVTELAPLRSLLECLKELSLRTSFPVLTLCDFAVQICEGMTYLENKRLIHRDLAARNILVFSKNKVKISDFGLSRALGVGKDYYQTNFNVNLKLPIAWCAPECISYLRFTSSSDVWAYAVTLWEMFSYGFQPWAGFSGHQILVAIDAPNYQRLEQPDSCPREYFALMQKCWHHDPSKRLKFSEILNLLPECKPEQVQAISVSESDSSNKRADQLNYRSGDILTVLDKGGNSAATQWKGILKNGTTGFFNPLNVVSYLGSSLPSAGNQNLLSRSWVGGNAEGWSGSAGSRSSARSSLRSSDSSSGRSRRRLRSDMISAPQGDVKHTGHVGLDGAYFGDVSFLEYNHLPRQVVTPYKPSEDLEQTPLINPNSPSHLSGNNAILLRETNPYQRSIESTDGKEPEFMLENDGNPNMYGSQSKSSKFNSNFDSLSLQSHISKVKWPGPANSLQGQQNEACSTGESHVALDVEQPHEYQEISDEDDQKPSDFGQSLLDEMESMFRSLGGHSRPATTSNQDPEGSNHRNELTELSSRLSHTASLSKKKQTSVKPISAHDQRMLDSAIALANELTAKSMTDLEHREQPATPTERGGSKFSFRFPLGEPSSSSSNAAQTHSKDSKMGENYGTKMEKRTFSQEAQSVPDIQSSLTEESKLAYESLVEQPAKLVTTLMKIRQKQGSQPQMTSKLPNVPPNIQHSTHDMSPHKSESADMLNCREDFQHKDKIEDIHHGVTDTDNPLPLPPRDRTVLSQYSRKRHTRKYPLIIQDSHLQRTLNRISSQSTSDHTLSSLTNNVQYTNTNYHTKSDYNPSIGQYQNVSNKFSFIGDDSFDTPSLKFEAQLENNFTSIDCCDGVGSDFECESSYLIKQTKASDESNNSVNVKSQKESSTEKPPVSFYNIANLEYIDGASCLNPFVDVESDDSCDRVINPFSNSPNYSVKNSTVSASHTNELARHALFNKIKTDLQTQEMLASKSVTEDSSIDSSSSIEKKILVEDGKDPAVLIKNKIISLDDQALLQKNKFVDPDWSIQRRSVDEIIDTPSMFVKGSPDRVSVEDLLEFADQKPCGRQRGTESDEVRIMCKVLNHQVSAETCLETLEFTSWNVHRAIKLVRLQTLAQDGPTLYECAAALTACSWDVPRAGLLLAAHRDTTDIADV